MKKLFWMVVFGCLVACSTLAEVTVTNLVVAQRPGTKLVDITYDLISADVDFCMVSFFVYEDTNKVFTPSVLGDVGSHIPIGIGKSFVWDSINDWSGDLASLEYAVSVEAEISYTCPVLATGQTNLYLAEDDGDLRPGVAWPEPRFVDSGNGTVLDVMTGLEWLKEPHSHFGDEVSISNAFNACNNFNYAGYSDWRLPNIKELVSLVCHTSGKSAEFLNSELTPFSGIHSDDYWSSTHAEGGAFFLSMYAGSIDETTSLTGQSYVFPVRGTSEAIAKTGQKIEYYSNDDGANQLGVEYPASRFQQLEDGTVIDRLTGLEWVRSPGLLFGNQGSKEWYPAVNFCNDLEFSNYSDWRLPTVKELQSLMDYDENIPDLLPEGHPFEDVNIDFYWSSTTFSSLSEVNWAHQVFFSPWTYGQVRPVPKDWDSHVWPVRRGGYGGQFATVSALLDTNHISHVDIHQRPGTKLVDIYYDLGGYNALPSYDIACEVYSQNEGFEMGSFSPSWSSSGDHQWEISSDAAYTGNYSAMMFASSLDAKASESLEWKGEFFAGDIVSFHYDIDLSGYDPSPYIKVYVDGISAAVYFNKTDDWDLASFLLGSDAKSIRWEVCTDYANYNQCIVSIDNIHIGNEVSLISLGGDVGSNVTPGVGKHIVWNAGEDWPDQVASLRALVSADGSFFSKPSSVGIDTRDYRLHIFSGYDGNPIPEAGSHSNYCWKSTVTCVVDSVIGASNEIVCTGWGGSGCFPDGGVSNNTGSVVLTDIDAMVRWKWSESPISITNITAVQRTGTKIVDITYDLIGSLSSDVRVGLSLVYDGEVLYAQNVSGDIGAGIFSGSGKTMTWDGGEEWGGVWGEDIELVLSVWTDGNPSFYLDVGDPSAVRWERLNERWIKNYYANGDITMTDRFLNLMWGFDVGKSGGLTWDNALAYCEDLTYAGHDDWFLPGRDSLNAVSSQSGLFLNVPGYIWSATRYDESYVYGRYYSSESLHLDSPYATYGTWPCRAATSSKIMASAAANLDLRDCSVSVFSDFGATYPPVGVHSNYTRGDVVSCSVAPALVEHNGVIYDCSGWLGSGSIAPAGDALQTGSIILTSSVSTIEWQWNGPVYNVEASQRPGTKLVDIYYDLKSRGVGSETVFLSAHNADVFTEDFEGDWPSSSWDKHPATGGWRWRVQSQEVHSGTSALGTDPVWGGNRDVELRGEFAKGTAVSFYRKVSTSVDYLAFYVDGVEKIRWDGQRGWEEVCYVFTNNATSLKWVYVDVSNYDLGDAWIDDLSFIEGGVSGVDIESYSGDIGSGINAGKQNHIIWDAGADWSDNFAYGMSFSLSLAGAPFAVSSLNTMVDTRSYSLAVSSPYGTPIPPVGTNYYAWGSIVTCSVSSVVSEGGDRFVCSGWNGEGVVQPSGQRYDSNTGVFRIENYVSSSMAWEWEITYLTNVIYYVSAFSGADPNDGLSLGGAKKTIQSAIDAAPSGATILIDDGTYYLNDEVDVGGKHLTIRSLNGAEAVAVDGQGITGCFNLGDTHSRLENLTIQSGKDESSTETYGGGVFCSEGSTNAVVENCTLLNNTAGYGGGMYYGTAENCTFIGNSGPYDYNGGLGGGKCGGVARFCVFDGNSAQGMGGGMHAGTAYSCTFTNNTVDYYGGGSGGGMSSGVAYDCNFISNVSGSTGGGASGGEVHRSFFKDNQSDSGGGMSRGSAHNCFFEGNSAIDGMGGGMWEGNAYGCVFYANQAVGYGGGLDSSRAYNSIVYENVSGWSPADIARAPEVHNCFQTSDGDPLFVDETGGDFRLSTVSPCIDAGDNSYVSSNEVTDLDGNLRLVDGNGDGSVLVDIGAYENQAFVSLEIAEASHATGSDAGEHLFDVSSTISWQAVPTVPWIVITQGFEGIGNGRVTYYFSSNATGAERVGSIQISGGEITRIHTLTQESASTTYPEGLKADNIRVSQRPGTKLVDVFYDLVGSDSEYAEVELHISLDGILLNAFSVAGHVGHKVPVGSDRQIIWDGGADWNGNAAELLYSLSVNERFVSGAGIAICPVMKTEQTEIYAEGDDGDLQAGASLDGERFINGLDGEWDWGPYPEFSWDDEYIPYSYYDQIAGIEWPSQWADMSPSYVTNSIQFYGNIDLLNYKQFFGYSDWRPANINELESILTDWEDLCTWDINNWNAPIAWASSTRFAANPVASWCIQIDGTITDWDWDGYEENKSKYFLVPVRNVTNMVSHLPKTGQRESFVAGDDGAYQAGVEWSVPRFWDNGDETVSDRLTGLEWIKDPGKLFSENSAPAWGDGVSFCNELHFGGYSDWRLPNRRELRSLIDYGQYSPALPPNHLFQGIDADDSVFWSSSSYSSDYAWTVDFRYGHVVRNYNKVLSRCHVWPVRGGRTLFESE